MAHRHTYGPPSSPTTLFVRCDCGKRAPLYRVDRPAYERALTAQRAAFLAE